MEGILFIVFVFILLPKLIEIAKNNKKNKAGQNGGAASAPRQTPSVQLNQPVLSMPRPAAHGAHRDFSAPEAPCIVCEQTGEDHFQRDKARRLAQLDDWLKIGLIDRSEYLVLRDRYQRGI